MSKHYIVLDSGKTYIVTLEPAGTTVDGNDLAVNLHELQPGVLSVLLTQPDGTTRSFRALAEEDAVIINGTRIPYTLADPRSLRAASALTGGGTGPRPLKAPMPGRIVRVLVALGDIVTAGQGCIVIEAMKMQNELKAPREGIVTKLTATPGDTVTPGTTLLIIE
jgi:biotin carboxyl carrier protein